MRKILRYLFISAVAAALIPVNAGAQDQVEEKPLVTIGGMSDLHTEYTMISCKNVDDVRLRESITITLDSMKNSENIDLMVFGGDYTSQVSATSQAHWERSRDLLVERSRNVFAPGKATPVIYTGGNHEFDAAGYGNNQIKKFACWDYYTLPMKDDIGLLDEDNAYYEVSADNGEFKSTDPDGNRLRILGAYYYQIQGLDFVVLNTGRPLAASNGNYFYTPQAADWVAQKLESLYAEDPDRTVFFVCHIPFGDSNSISESDKGQDESKMLNVFGKQRNAAKELKATLAKYPNTIMLYGHDHGTDKAYIREKTSQRVTRYDVNGKKISQFDDTHVDAGSTGPVEPDPVYYLKSYESGKYLGAKKQSNSNITLTDKDGRQAVTISKNGDLLLTQIITDEGTFYLSAGTGYNFKSDGKQGTNEQNNGYWFKVSDPTATTFSAVKVDAPEADSLYIIIQNYQGYMALSNELVDKGSEKWRINGIAVSGMSATTTTLTLDQATYGKCIYQYELEKKDAEPVTDGKFYLKSFGNGKYVANDGSNITMSDTKVEAHVQLIAGGLFKTTFAEDTYNLSCGGSGRYSLKDRISSTNTQENGYWFMVEDPSATPVVATKVSAIIPGKNYVIVQNYSGDFALGNTIYGEGSGARIESVAVTVTQDKVKFATPEDAKNYIYTLEPVESKPEPTADPSFISVFLGSMRYYNNAIEGSWVSSSYERTPKIIQAMMIYVYQDRIEFHMKNYGSTGKLTDFEGKPTSVELAEVPAPYIVYRNVKLKNDHPTPTAMKIINEEQIRNAKLYSIFGTEVDENYHGIVISNGEKFYKE